MIFKAFFLWGRVAVLLAPCFHFHPMLFLPLAKKKKKNHFYDLLGFHFSILFCQCHPSASWSLPPLFQSLGIWPISPTTIPSFTAHVRIHLIKWPLTPQVLISRTLLQVIHSSAHALTGCCITRNSSIFRIPDANNLCTSLLPLLLSCSPDIVLQPHSDFSFLHQP